MGRLTINFRHPVALRVTSIVVFMLSLCCFESESVLAQTSRSMQDTERFVKQKVREGLDVTLDDETGRKISATFLTMLLESYKPPTDRPSRGIHITNAEVSGPLTLDRVTIPYWLTLESCTFTGDVDFTGSSFQKDLSLSKSSFEGRAIFYQINVEGELRVNKGQYKKETNFDDIKVSGTVQLYQSKFDGPVTLANSEMNKLECADDDEKLEHAEFRSSVDFYSINVKGDASFTHTTFAGPANFGSSYIGKNLELTKTQFTDQYAVVGFFSMRVGGNAHFNETQFRGGFDLGQAEVTGRLEFGNTQATNPKLNKSFSGMKVGTLTFNNAALAPPYDLGSAEYHNLSVHSGGKNASLDLINASVYNRANYSSLEDYYRRIGSDAAADEVYLAGKDAERGKLYADSGISARYLWSSFLKITVGYGKKPQRALLLSLLFIGIGCAFFFKEDWMMLQRNDDQANYGKTYNPLWYSIALFLPIVDLGDTKIWAPSTKRRLARHYMRVHVVLGYLLVPIGLAAWTGLLK